MHQQLHLKMKINSKKHPESMVKLSTSGELIELTRFQNWALNTTKFVQSHPSAKLMAY